MLDEFSIVTAFDVNFIELAAVFFLSLSARGVNLGNLQGIYAMVSGLSQAERDMLNKLAPMDIVFIDVSELLERELPSVYTNHIPLMSYARLFMLDLVPVEHRILYIDPDTIVLGSLRGLAALDLEGRPVGRRRPAAAGRAARSPSWAFPTIGGISMLAFSPSIRQPGKRRAFPSGPSALPSITVTCPGITTRMR